MLHKCKDFITYNQLITPADSTLVAVSGGVDSVVLAHLLHSLGFDIVLAHCNFKLRAQESDQDQRFVAQLAKTLKVPFHTTSFETKTIAQQDGQSIQLTARKLRYQWFEQLVQKGCTKIATAHHLNDDLETTLYNLTKGSGIRGIAGIPLKNKQVVRPLLSTSRDEILAYAKSNNLEWREDKTNASTKYTRNFIRHEVVPKLKEVNKSLEKSFRNTSSRLKSANDLVAYHVDNLLDNQVGEEGNLEVSKRAIPEKGRLALVFELMRRFGFGITEVNNVLLQWDKVGTVFLSTSHVLNIDRSSLFIKEHQIQPDAVFEITEDTTEIVLLHQKLVVQKSSKVPPSLKVAKNIALLDWSKLVFPLILRRWARGDVFQPLGMKGKKKLSDFMIDQKIPLNLKSELWVLESGNEVVWLVGQRVDDRFKVETQTDTILRLELI